MEVAYNLKYQKSGFKSRNFLDKEGEIIIYDKGFRLKGKGAGDKGELINFSEIKEFYTREDKVVFVTFSKEKYVLSEAGTLFEQLLNDLYKSRNKFLCDALFMKKGKFKGEFDGGFERVSKFGKPISKGNGAKIQLYQGSVVIIPQLSDAFSLNVNFVNFHEFDDFEYRGKIVMDDGQQVFISQLGDYFESFQEQFEMCLAEMYQTVVDKTLREAFPHFNAGTLLQLAYMMKGGKLVSLYDIKDIDQSLYEEVWQFMMSNEDFKEKAEFLIEGVADDRVLIAIGRDEKSVDGFVKMLVVAKPESNTTVMMMSPRFENEVSEAYFYKVIMEKGDASDKLDSKYAEINGAMISLDFAKDPCYRDKRDLKHSPYLYAIRKMPFLRILRKSYVGRARDIEGFKRATSSCSL